MTAEIIGRLSNESSDEDRLIKESVSWGIPHMEQDCHSAFQ
jgi:hypothetical protein